MIEKFKYFLLDCLERHQSRSGRWFAYFLIFCILGSTTVFVLQTTPLESKWGSHFRIFDSFVIVIFTLEYFLRLWVAPKRRDFVFSSLGILDAVVLLAFYLTFVDIFFLRGFRVLRIFQILKIVRYSDVMLSFMKSFRYYRDEVKIFTLTLFLVLISSSFGLYALEKGQNSQGFDTIPDAIWWAVVTITTVGYGDAVPTTVGGKILASLVMWLGLATIAIMTALVTKIFIDHFFGKRLHSCEKCHFPHHDHDAKFCKNCGALLDAEKLQKASKIIQ